MLHGHPATEPATHTALRDAARRWPAVSMATGVKIYMRAACARARAASPDAALVCARQLARNRDAFQHTMGRVSAAGWLLVIRALNRSWPTTTWVEPVDARRSASGQ
jgi:hypothetical protein